MRAPFGFRMCVPAVFGSFDGLIGDYGSRFYVISYRARFRICAARFRDLALSIMVRCVICVFRVQGKFSLDANSFFICEIDISPVFVRGRSVFDFVGAVNF